MSQHPARALLGAAIVLALGGCNGTGQPMAADADSVKQAMKADEKAWNAQFNAKPQDLEALVGHYADDGYFVAPGINPASGGTEIRQTYAKGLGDPNFAISFASDKMDVAASGDLAYTRGRFTEKYSDPKTNQPVSEKGSYITVYKKQADGSWKAVEDFAAADPGEPTPMTPAKAVTRAKMTSF